MEERLVIVILDNLTDKLHRVVVLKADALARIISETAEGNSILNVFTE